jgi:hypothetical protein
MPFNTVHDSHAISRPIYPCPDPSPIHPRCPPYTTHTSTPARVTPHPYQPPTSQEERLLRQLLARVEVRGEASENIRAGRDMKLMHCLQKHDIKSKNTRKHYPPQKDTAHKNTAHKNTTKTALTSSLWAPQAHSVP